MWKSNWGKAAIIGVGMVGYGALSKATAGYVPSFKGSLLERQILPSYGKTGFLADIQRKAAQVIGTPFAIGEAFAGKGYDYLLGRGNVTFSDFKGELGRATGWLNSDVAKSTLDWLRGGAPSGKPGGGGGRRQVAHGQVAPIDVSGDIQQKYKYRPWNQYDPTRLASNMLQLAHSDKYYKDIQQQAGGVTRIGPNINVKEATLRVTKPSLRYTV